MLWTFAAEDPGTPAQAREAVRAFAADQGADGDTLAAIELCVSEAVSNAATHAYRKLGRRGPVEVEARHPGDYLSVYVRDQGSGPRRRQDSPGLGLGLPLIGQAAADFDVRPRATGGTEVLMVFELSQRNTPAMNDERGSAPAR
jgi:anti-sigma regulatory factor (Ser/Thr protein kinase)